MDFTTFGKLFVILSICVVDGNVIDVGSIKDLIQPGEGCYDNCISLLPKEYYWRSYCMYHCVIMVHMYTPDTTTIPSTTTTNVTTRSTTPTTTTTTSTTTTSTTTTSTTSTTTTTTRSTKKKRKIKVVQVDQKCGHSVMLSLTPISERDEAFYVREENVDGSRVDDVLVDIPPSVSNIVVNGNNVNQEERYPWLVALRTSSGHHYCGGAVLNTRWILTAAHCQFDIRLDIIVGKTIFRETGKSDNEVVMRGQKVVDHPLAGRSKYGTWNFDFELVQVENKIKFDQMISPICIPSADMKFTGKNCWLAGWGRIQASPKRYADKLQEIHARVNEYCGGYEALVSEDSFCFGYNGQNSGCNGDSGSPLVCAGSGGQFFVAGVASWASLNCAPSTPTGFAKVSHVTKWITSVIGK